MLRPGERARPAAHTPTPREKPPGPVPLILPLLAAAAAALAGLTACTAPQAPRPNILILLMDTLRADRLGCYGYGKPTSPAVDRLAQRGTLFTRCYAPSDYTHASTASLFTGRYPLAHGYMNSDYVLEDANLTMAEIFRDAGYTTAAFIANGLAGRKYRMDQGFHEHFEKNRASAFELSEAATEFIDRHSQEGDRPFLAYLHFLDVHDPHRIPAAEFSRMADPSAFAFDMQDTLLLETMVMRAWWSTVQKWRDEGEDPGQVARYFEDYSDLYDSSIAYWDEAVGAILEALRRNGLDRNTVVLVTSDHGEQLLEHGFFGHANSGYDVGLHVPLVLFDPAEDGIGRRIFRPVSLIDVLPSLLARAGVPVPKQVQGRSWWPFSRAGSSPATDARPVYSEGTFFANRPVGTLIQTIREGKWKLILDRLRDSKELYDLSRDPGETRNLLEIETEVAARLYGEMQRHYNRHLNSFNARQRSQADRTAEKLRELRSLGYVTPPGPRRHRLAIQYFPMAGAAVHRFGPFGDEEDLGRFSDHLDLTRPGGPPSDRSSGAAARTRPGRTAAASGSTAAPPSSCTTTEPGAASASRPPSTRGARRLSPRSRSSSTTRPGRSSRWREGAASGWKPLCRTRCAGRATSTRGCSPTAASSCARGRRRERTAGRP